MLLIESNHPFHICQDDYPLQEMGKPKETLVKQKIFISLYWLLGTTATVYHKLGDLKQQQFGSSGEV